MASGSYSFSLWLSADETCCCAITARSFVIHGLIMNHWHPKGTSPCQRAKREKICKSCSRSSQVSNKKLGNQTAADCGVESELLLENPFCPSQPVSLLNQRTRSYNTFEPFPTGWCRNSRNSSLPIFPSRVRISCIVRHDLQYDLKFLNLKIPGKHIPRVF